MKKSLISGLLMTIVLTALVLPAIASASFLGDIWNWVTGGSGAGSPNNAPKIAPSTDPIAVLTNLTNWLFAILVVVAALAIMIASYYFITAAGDAEKIKTARQFVIYALVGVFVGAMAIGLVNLVGRIAGA